MPGARPGLFAFHQHSPSAKLGGVVKVAFITHYCTHYRVKTYETLAKYEDVTYFFYSAGKEKYWDPSHGVSRGSFRHQYLPGFQFGRTRVAPSLLTTLWRGDFDVYVKCVNGKFALPAAYLAARLRRKPFVLWTGIWMRQQTLAHRLGWPLTRYFYRHADAIVTYGTHVNAFLEREGINPNKLFAAKHAIDNSEYNQPVPAADQDALRAKLRISAHQKVVLFVGRLVEVKGLVYLLAAFAQASTPDSVLVLAGHGPEEAKLRQQAETLGISDRLRFCGYVPTSSITPYYAIAWIHVLPSVTTPLERETWGLVVNEAFNQGVPSIASDAVGAAAGGLITHDETGLIFAEKDTAALAGCLNRLFTESGLRQRLGTAARERISVWDNESMVSAFRQAIRHAAAKSPRVASAAMGRT